LSTKSRSRKSSWKSRAGATRSRPEGLGLSAPSPEEQAGRHAEDVNRISF
jgi:hypothetical protein